MSKVVKIVGDFGARRFAQNFTQAQKIIDSQVLSDTQPYVPRDSSDLMSSGVRATKIGSGKVIWDEPHAYKQYNKFPNKAQDKNPLAVIKWFEASKSVNREKWLRVAKKAAGAK